MKKEGKKEIRITSFFPVDPPGCVCHGEIAGLQNMLASKSESKRKQIMGELGKMTCPKNKEEYSKYKIVCNNCKEEVAELYARNKKIGQDWCDLHYIQRVVKTANTAEWVGCATVNISPTDGNLGIECFCGQDTRDFRSGQGSLRGGALFRKIEETMKGRRFAKKNSKFKVIKLEK